MSDSHSNWNTVVTIVVTATAVCRGSLCAGARPRLPRFVEVGLLVMERGHCPGPVVSAKGRGSGELKHISDFRGSRGYGLRCPGNAFCRWWLFSWRFDRGCLESERQTGKRRVSGKRSVPHFMMAIPFPGTR